MQRKFCEVFSENGGNVYAAARAAGYKQPRIQGTENMGKPSIITALEKLRESETNASIATRSERQQFWSATMRNDELSISDRLRASELLGKSQADFVDRSLIEVGIGIGVTLYVPDNHRMTKIEET